MLVKILTSNQFRSKIEKSGAFDVLDRIIEQEQQIGEQLKEIGIGLDSIGERRVLVPQKQIDKKEEEQKQFVSNIEPDDEIDAHIQENWNEITAEGELIVKDDDGNILTSKEEIEAHKKKFGDEDVDIRSH
jgi:flagellar biosynthesis/type III secretory pathway chaperone